MANIHYELAAAGFFFLIFAVSLEKKKLALKSTIAFQMLLFTMMLTGFFIVGDEFAYANGKSTELIALAKAISLCLELGTFACCHCYILSLAYRLQMRSVLFIVSEPVLLLSVSLLLSSPWTGLCFFYDEGRQFHQTWLLELIALAVILYLIYDVVVLFAECTQYTIRRKCACALLLAVFAGLVLFDVFAPSWKAQLLVCILAFVYIFYLSQQSPDFYVDNATGSFNRNGFIELFRERISYRTETACLLVRVRNFSSLNKIYGEEKLQEVQRKIRGLLLEKAPKGKVFHIGASTYAVLLHSEEEAAALYNSIKRRLPTVWMVDGEAINHEYSFYLSVYPEDGEDFEELIQRIHYARSDHESSHAPGELVRLRHDTIEEVENKKKVAHLVEDAIMDNSIELHFQPIYSLEKKRITSLEVLSRLKDEDKQYINPEYFIHIAEENHTIIPLGEQIFRKACEFAKRNRIFEKGIEDININLSPGQCRYEGLTERLREIAGQYQIPMERMHLEITESEFTDAAAVGRTLRSLKQTGAKVAMDDFGTGFSTLVNILELPVDFVKIDKSLVWSYAKGENQFLNDLMPMIKAEGKKIIAEGIETQEHIDIIKRLQGDFLQGYFFSKPLPEIQFIRFLEDFNRRTSERI